MNVFRAALSRDFWITFLVLILAAKCLRREGSFETSESGRRNDASCAQGSCKKTYFIGPFSFVLRYGTRVSIQVVG
jgi:hypothetical protein